MTSKSRILAVLAWATVTAMCVAGPVVYVDADAPGSNDGSSWEDAFRDLQDALIAVGKDSRGEIRIANGTYRPDGGSGCRGCSFALRSTVAIRGGYAGWGEPDPDTRDYSVYETILSGDLFGNDGPDFAGNVENSYNVVFSGNDRDDTLLEGVTITGGNGDAAGPPGDLRSRSGGGLHIQGGSPVFIHCTFRGNRADFGGAVYSSSGALVRPWFIHCIFVDNVAEQGGAVFNKSTDAAFFGCLFLGNHAQQGGAVYENFFAEVNGNTAELRHCTFRGNTADVGSVLYAEDGPHRTAVLSCILWANGLSEQTSQVGGRIPSFSRCTVEGWTGSWGGSFNNGLDPLFADEFGRLSPGSPCIDSGANSHWGQVFHGVLVDLDGLPRFVDVPHITDTGSGEVPIIDRGAFEFQFTSCKEEADCFDNNPCTVDACDDETSACVNAPVVCMPGYFCAGGFCITRCDRVDTDGDGDIDLWDFAAWQNCFTGPGK